MPIRDVQVYYVEMRAHAQRTVPPPRDGLAVIHAKKPTVGYYRYLYDAVGREYNWRSRAKLSDAELKAILDDPLVELHGFFVDGVPCGFGELDRRIPNEVELKQFGLMREFIGQGLGKYFLQRTIDIAWQPRPERFWLHTCTVDHEAALPNYLKSGFALYKEESIRAEVELPA